MSITRRTFLQLAGAAALCSSTLSIAVNAAGAKTMRPAIAALLYHEIADPLRDVYTVSSSSFAAQMEWLYANGYSTLFTNELGRFVADGAGQAVVITFDDGDASFLDYAFPLLEEYRFKATMNIIGKAVDNHELIDRQRPIMSWDECRHLLSSGLVDLGCHTYALHSPGGVLTASYPAIERDLMLFQERFAKELGRRCTVIAWPYGIYDATCIEIARKAGFTHLLTSNEGLIGKESVMSELPRLNINDKLDLVSFQQYIGAAP